MALPPFREDGTLPIGEHVASWAELESRFGGGHRRTTLVNGLRAALDELQRVGCTAAWIDGSFVTNKAEPNDFDMCWDEAGVDVAALDPSLPLLREQTGSSEGPVRRRDVPGRRASRCSGNNVSTVLSAEVRSRQGYRPDRLVRVRNDHH